MHPTRIFGTLHGSKLFGLATPHSDTDIKGLLLPSAEDILTCRAPSREDVHRKKAHGERNQASDVDITFFGAPTFVDMLLAGDPTGFEVLFAPPGMHTADTTALGRQFMGQLQAGASRLISRDMQPFLSYANRQVHSWQKKTQALAEIKAFIAELHAHTDKRTLADIGWKELAKALPASNQIVRIRRDPADLKGLAFNVMLYTTRFAQSATRQDVLLSLTQRSQQFAPRTQQAQINGGVDFKALSHALRVLEEGHELLTTGALTFPRPTAPALLAIKLGQRPAAGVLLDIERATDRLVQASLASALPAERDKTWALGRVMWLHSTQVALWQFSQRIPPAVQDGDAKDPPPADQMAQGS